MAATIRPYEPGDLGRLATLHAVYYAANWSFPGRFFEAKITAAMVAFLDTLDSPQNGWWSAAVDGQYVGGIVIDGNETAAAQLRWFILSDEARGQGLGRRLLDDAMAHCRAQRFPLVYLNTFQGLDPARALYESAGFHLVRELENTSWGTPKVEQRFEWAPQ